MELLRRLPRPGDGAPRRRPAAVHRGPRRDLPPAAGGVRRRRDKVAQAVSLWKAIQTDQWRNEVDGDGGGQPVEYDYRAIKHLVDELYRWDARWEDWFHATGREPIRVIYEEFVTARAATVGRVLNGLGVDPPERRAR